MKKIRILVFNSLGAEINNVPTTQDELGKELLSIAKVGLEAGDVIKFEDID